MNWIDFFVRNWRKQRRCRSYRRINAQCQWMSSGSSSTPGARVVHNRVSVLRRAASVPTWPPIHWFEYSSIIIIFEVRVDARSYPTLMYSPYIFVWWGDNSHPLLRVAKLSSHNKPEQLRSARGSRLPKHELEGRVRDRAAHLAQRPAWKRVLQTHRQSRVPLSVRKPGELRIRTHTRAVAQKCSLVHITVLPTYSNAYEYLVELVLSFLIWILYYSKS